MYDDTDNDDVIVLSIIFLHKHFILPGLVVEDDLVERE